MFHTKNAALHYCGTITLLAVHRFCFVEYSNSEDAAKAIRALHGRKLYGRPLRVRFMTVEGSGRMDYSTTDSRSSSGGSFVNNG